VNPRLIVLLGLAAALAAFYFYVDNGAQRATIPDEQKTAQVAQTDSNEATTLQTLRKSSASLNPRNALTPKNIAASLDRPLFNQSRQNRPAPPPEQPDPPPVEQVEIEEAPAEPPAEDLPQPSDYSLLAVSSGPDKRIAAVRINESNTVVYVSRGQAVSKWNVMEVGERDIKIGAGENFIVLKLFSGESQEEAPEPQDEASEPQQ
jgi:hypothetical protein